MFKLLPAGESLDAQLNESRRWFGNDRLGPKLLPSLRRGRLNRRSLAYRRLNPFRHTLHTVRQLRLQRIGHRNSAWMDRSIIYVFGCRRIQQICEAEFDGRFGLIFHDLEINLGFIILRLSTDNNAPPPATRCPST